jgi:hypothetical protein
MSNYVLHPEATPDKSFAELLDLLQKNGAKEMALIKNNAVTHLIGQAINQNAIYVVFLDQERQGQVISENLLNLTPEDLSHAMKEAGINSRTVYRSLLNLRKYGDLKLEKDISLTKKFLEVLFFSENQKFIKFVDAQNGSGARSLGPYSFGHTTIKKTLSFYERFGRFPISEKETELLSNDRALKGLELAGPERAVHVFKEKILAVPRGTVKLPGGYEVVVPENIVELKHNKIYNLVFKNEDHVCEPCSRFGFNYFWTLPLQMAADYLSAMERIIERSDIGSVAGDLVSGISLTEGRGLTAKELQVLTSLAIKHEIRLVKEDPHTGGLLLGNRKNKFGYQKGTLNFMLTTGRFPNPAEAVKNQKIAKLKNDELGER